MPLPKNGTEILYTDKHPYHADKSGEVFGTVIDRKAFTITIMLPCGNIDHIYWKSTDGTSNPFYGTKSPRH